MDPDTEVLADALAQAVETEGDARVELEEVIGDNQVAIAEIDSATRIAVEEEQTEQARIHAAARVAEAEAHAGGTEEWQLRLRNLEQATAGTQETVGRLVEAVEALETRLIPTSSAQPPNLSPPPPIAEGDEPIRDGPRASPEEPNTESSPAPKVPRFRRM